MTELGESRGGADPSGTYQIPAFLLYTPQRRLGGTGILPVAGWTGFTELNGGFLSCVDLSTGSDRFHPSKILVLVILLACGLLVAKELRHITGDVFAVKDDFVGVSLGLEPWYCNRLAVF